jgi:hypothetical protein
LPNVVGGGWEGGATVMTECIPTKEVKDDLEHHEKDLGNKQENKNTTMNTTMNTCKTTMKVRK